MKNTIQKLLILSLMVCASSLAIAAQTRAPAPVNLISWWNADGNALDSRSRSSENLRNGAGLAIGGAGRGFNFDGINDRVMIAGDDNLSSQAPAADGDLDPTFGTGGKVTTDFNNQLDQANGVAVQTDGRIVVVGTTGHFGVARYNTNGSLDTTFDGDGKVITSFGIGAIARAVAIQADGKIVVAGHTPTSEVGGSQLFALARFNPNGSLDSTFDADGKVTTAFAVSAGANSVVVQSDGSIIAAGGSSLARYQNSGALDNSFGTGGKVFISSAGIRAAAIQTDGKIVVTGISRVTGSDIDFALTRLTSTGFFDTTFGTNGRVTTDFGSTTELSFGIAIQSDGKIVTVGQSGVTVNSHFAIARHNVNGSLDTSFSDDGKVLTQIVPNVEASASAAAIQSDGKIVVAGRTGNSGTTNDFAVVRYQSGAPIAPRPHQFDFDGDGRDDLAVYRPSVGNWFVQRSQAGFLGQTFGASEDMITPADYDGDGKTDIAVFRPSNGTWYLQRSLAGFVGIQFGSNGDVPLPADYDGDGQTDLAVYRPSTGTWFTSLNPATNYGAVRFGAAGDKPIPADFDGDGKTDIAVFRPSNGVWYLLQSSAGFSGTSFGISSDTPVPADYDGDGRADIAVYRGGTWYLLRSTAGFSAVQFGAADDVPIPAKGL